MPLTAALVRRQRTPGKYGDGRGLWLQIITPERRSWLFRYTLAGRERYMGLGSAQDVSLAEARDAAESARRLIRDGVDPIEHRRASRKVAIEARERTVTFAQAAAHYIAANEAGWRNPQNQNQWRSSIRRYALPVIGDLPCGAIGTSHVLKILEPIWRSKPETAGRVRGRLETVLSYATVRGWREGPNPAVWRGHLQLMLPAKAKVHEVKHHAALDWREMPAFMAQLRGRATEHGGMGARALAFAILTAARSGEVRGARWGEIDLERATWTIPAARMKGAREHRVPLAVPALAILIELATLMDPSGLVFHGQRHGTLMSDVTLTAVLRRMGRGDLTAHGFRSSFRDWAAETTAHPNHVVELALAHAIGNKVEAAYRRGDLFEKRAALMADWAAYLSRPRAEVVALRVG
jgi:integrase